MRNKDLPLWLRLLRESRALRAVADAFTNAGEATRESASRFWEDSGRATWKPVWETVKRPLLVAVLAVCAFISIGALIRMALEPHAIETFVYLAILLGVIVFTYRSGRR